MWWFIIIAGIFRGLSDSSRKRRNAPGIFCKEISRNLLSSQLFHAAIWNNCDNIFIIIVVGFPPLIWIGVFFYILGIADAVKSDQLESAAIFSLCIYLSHLSYAYNFVKGLLFMKHLER